MNKQLPVYKLHINENDNNDLQVNYVALVDTPAVELNWMAFDKKIRFAADNERRLIMGALMVANMPIYRKDETRGEYYVVFDKETIYQIIQKFFLKCFISNFNIMHDEGRTVEGVYIIESFIVDDTRGVSAPKAFEGISQGSWLATVKVDNDEVWNNYIKTDVEILQEIADIVTGK